MRCLHWPTSFPSLYFFRVLFQTTDDDGVHAFFADDDGVYAFFAVELGAVSNIRMTYDDSLHPFPRHLHPKRSHCYHVLSQLVFLNEAEEFSIARASSSSCSGLPHLISYYQSPDVNNSRFPNLLRRVHQFIQLSHLFRTKFLKSILIQLPPLPIAFRLLQLVEIVFPLREEADDV